mmetsp:Transcript_5995/g.11768  ORF Transcript_5995/g.11768 Transcript_5995/m.11768 type:complete len:254 (-) Transcript_5995:1624-2385(-)
MPKARRSTSLSRVARRRLVDSENLPSPATRKKEEQRDGVELDTTSDKTTTTTASSLENKKIHIGEKQNATSTHKESQKKNTATKKVDIDNDDEPDVSSKQQLSRGQRKRQAKREQFLRKEKMILSSLMLQRQEEQKKRIDGLDAIKQALMDTANKDGNKNSNTIAVQHVSTNRAKRKLVAKEVAHMNLILQHPAFKKDPFETMQEHLRNTLAEERKQQEIVSQKRAEEDKKKTDAKKSIKKKSQKKKIQTAAN